MTLSGSDIVARRRSPGLRQAVRQTSDHSGTQCLDRAIAILKDLASQSPIGCRLADIAEATGTARPTAHRILKKLVQSDLVTQERGTHLYKLGPFGFAIESGPRPEQLIRISRPGLERVAAETGLIALLISRNGRLSLCCDRVDGTAGAKIRHPAIGQAGHGGLLGPSAGGVAILASLHDAQIDDILFENEWMMFGYSYGRISREALLSMIAATRRDGYCHTRGEFVADIGSVAVAVPAATGRTFAALAVVGMASDLTPEVAQKVVAFLKREAGAIADAWAKKRRGRSNPGQRQLVAF